MLPLWEVAETFREGVNLDEVNEGGLWGMLTSGHFLSDSLLSGPPKGE